CVNVHGSLLPKYRGASPIQSAVLAGEKETGVTFMIMDELVDHGPIFGMYTIPLSASDTTETVFEKLSILSAQHFPADLLKLITGNIKSHEQDHEHATFTKLLSRETGYIHWDTMTAQQIVHMINALVPWPGVTTRLNNGPLKLMKAHMSNDVLHSSQPGTLHIEKEIVSLETIDGELIIDELQPAGSAAMSAAAFARGNQTLSGSRCVAMSTDDVSQK
ncbi:MAG: formyltransferase family protein, partial [Candidatus Magasanikbacteria bacterium]|nr:formyltransferase family protein [Candidatus Magasanikbacteria bacterium]